MTNFLFSSRSALDILTFSCRTQKTINSCNYAEAAKQDMANHDTATAMFRRQDKVLMLNKMHLNQVEKSPSSTEHFPNGILVYQHALLFGDK